MKRTGKFFLRWRSTHRADSFHWCRVGVMIRRVPRMGRQVRQIFHRKIDQGILHRFAVAQGERSKAIRFVFMLA